MYNCRPRDCEFDPPSLQLKLLKKEVCTGYSQEKCSRVSYQCFTLGTLKNLVCHVPWYLVSILHYGPLIVTNNLHAPTPNGQSPSGSLNKITPPPDTYSYFVSSGYSAHTSWTCLTPHWQK